VLPSGEVVCGPCVRSAWDWLAKHGERKYRAGPKGKGSKYIAFPTGITKKNPGRREKAVVVQVRPQFPGDLGRRFRFRGGSAVELEIQVGNHGGWVNANRCEVGDSFTDAWHPYKSPPPPKSPKKNPVPRDCVKCGGTGRIRQFAHYADGICFDCAGTGVPRKSSRRGPSLPPSEPESVEKKIAWTVGDLRTAWGNYGVNYRQRTLDEMWLNFSQGRYDREWDEFVHKERTTKPAPATVGDGKKEWLKWVQFCLDDLRKLGAGEKADEIAKQFQTRLHAPVKNRSRRTSRRRTSRR
jgi:hypothetical protein